MTGTEQTENSQARGNPVNHWIDFMNSWNRSTSEFMSGEFKNNNGNGNGNLFGRWNPISDWGKMGEHLNRMMRTTLVKGGALNEIGEPFSKRSAALRQLQDDWLDHWVLLSRKMYEVAFESIKNETVRPDDFFNSLDSATITLDHSLRNFLKDTPYAELENVSSAARKWVEAFPEEKKVVKALWAEWISFQRKMAKLSGKAVRDGMAAGEAGGDNQIYSADVVRQMISEYGLLLKKIAEIPHIPNEIKQALAMRTDDGVHVTEKGLESALSGAELMVRFNRSLSQSTRDLFSFSNALKIWTGENPFREWGLLPEAFIRKTIHNARLSDGMSKCIADYTEWVKASMEFRSNLFASPGLPPENPQTRKPSGAKPKTAVAVTE